MQKRITFVAMSEYSLLYQQDIKNEVLAVSFNPNYQFLCYEQKYDPPKMIVKHKPSSQSLNYTKYGQFIFNTSQKERISFDDKISISKSGKYIGGVINNQQYIYIYKYNQVNSIYQYFNGFQSLKANKTTIHNIYFNPNIDQQITIVTNGYVQMRFINGSQLQVLQGSGNNQNTAQYSKSGKYFITGLSSINIFKRSDLSIFQTYQVISIQDNALCLSISPDQQYIAISTQKIVEIYKYAKDHDHFQIFQLINQTSNTLKFSSNSQILLLIKDQQMSIYRNINQTYTHSQSISHQLSVGLVSNSYNDFIGFSQYSYQFYGYCKTLYCQKCQRFATSCKNCIQQYYLLNQFTCISCKGLKQGCVSCSSKDYCDSCHQQYTVYNGNCVYCNIKNCQQCKQQSKCYQCKTGYDMDNNKCIGGNGSNVGLIIGLVVGMVILILIVTGGVFYCKKSKIKKQSLLQVDAQNED